MNKDGGGRRFMDRVFGFLGIEQTAGQHQIAHDGVANDPLDANTAAPAHENAALTKISATRSFRDVTSRLARDVDFRARGACHQATIVCECDKAKSHGDHARSIGAGCIVNARKQSAL